MEENGKNLQEEWCYLQNGKLNKQLPPIGRIVLVVINIPLKDRPAIFDFAYINKKNEWIDISGRLISSEQVHCWAEIRSPKDSSNLEKVRVKAFVNAAKVANVKIGENLYSPGDNAIVEVLSVKPKKYFIGEKNAMIKVIKGKIKGENQRLYEKGGVSSPTRRV